MSCEDCSKFCLCNCGTTETRTEIILYPVCQYKKNFKLPRRKPEKDEEKQSILQNHKQHSFSRSTRITETFDSANKIGSRSSLFLNPKSKMKHFDEADLDTIRQNRNENKQNEEENLYENEVKTKKNSCMLQSKVSAFASQRTINSQPSTIRNSDITIKLLSRENDQLRDQLDRLRKEEKELLQFQKSTKAKNDRELTLLKERCEDIERRSLKRQGELVQLKNLLSIAKCRKRKQSTNRKKY